MSDLNITQNTHTLENDSVLDEGARGAGCYGESPRDRATPYLTRTNNSTATPVNFDPDILSRSKSLVDGLMVESVLDPDGYRIKFKKGFVRYRKSGKFIECYENPNPIGNSKCLYGLNKSNNVLLESNSENARFSSYNRLVRIIQSNPQMCWFFTGTLDPKKCIRNDFKGFYVPFQRFLSRKGIKYILVPEFHADGENIHLHGLFDSTIEPYLAPFCPDAHLPYYILDALEQGLEVCNFPDYQKRFGYVSVSHVKNPDAISHYVSKYILKSIKDSECRVAHRRFYCSTGLNRPIFDIPTHEDLCALEPDYYSAKIVKVYGKEHDNANAQGCAVANHSLEGA